MEEADIIKTLLSDNWNSSNTGGNTPIIDLILNRNDIDVRKADFLLTYNTGAGPIKHSGNKTFDHAWTVSIDLRTMLFTRYKLYVDEIRRVIESKYILPSTGYHRLTLVRDVDLSDRSRGMYRRVIDVALMKDLETIE
ncbi:MAG: hypothetical protein KAJ93_02360 [Methanosarcinales archaeon]|nr:hypothetical protein [Methanosarcinales archaeon]